MLEILKVKDVKRVSRLAEAARALRDELLRPVREQDLGQPKPARGKHDPGRDRLLASPPCALPGAPA